MIRAAQIPRRKAGQIVTYPVPSPHQQARQDRTVEVLAAALKFKPRTKRKPETSR